MKGRKFYVQFESEIGPYYYTETINGRACFTCDKDKAVRFYTKREAQERATKYDGIVKREVVI